MTEDQRTVTREFYETDSYYGHPTPNMGLRAPSVSKVNIESIIEDMHQKGLDIYVNSSEKEISYTSAGKQTEAKVPLLAGFSNFNVDVTGLIMRHESPGANLEITVRDYHGHTRMSPRGVIGGNVSVTAGIHCTIEYKGSRENEKLIEIAESVIKKHYGRFSSLGSKD
jgi:hypothetical protein